MRVLMLGWEFPPFISGGLGTACYGLTRAMSRHGIEVVFVLPRPVVSQFTTHVKLAAPKAAPGGGFEPVPGSAPGDSLSREYHLREFENVAFRTIDTPLLPYHGQAEYFRRVEELRSRGELTEVALREISAGQLPAIGGGGGRSTPGPVVPSVSPGHDYAGDMMGEVHRYARLAVEIARGEHFDVVHAHDWMTYPAGLAVSAFSRRPLVVHIHSTEFDRSGEHINQQIYDIERAGLHGADRVIAVSYLTRNIVMMRYSVPGEKVEVVYNAIDTDGHAASLSRIEKRDKIVLFLGRITMQKGPEYFLAAARKVLDFYKDVKFVVAGSGDMTRRMIELSAEMGIGHKVLFTGFLRGADVDRVFKMADLYVMPSVSEPFGIAPLEAIRNDVPVIISKQSGVSEILTHVLKVDFWDINEMANKILAVLRHEPLGATLRRHSGFEVQTLTWDKSAARVEDVYRHAVTNHR
ncbi:MAG: D-inositol-3-phosphate glycosyltransferase [Phycisphaerae bacterium]|nr:D-inositol-3-phosphate glycosyltransferase [Phycisphaerae bacterium]